MRGDLWINPGNHCGPRLTRTGCFLDTTHSRNETLWNIGPGGSVLVQFDVGGADHFGPLLRLLADEVGEISGRTGKHSAT
jgi:hypothetical protein